ncbi:MAG TPA: ATP synthase F1 subunit epsilon [Stellaceae bacterium]|nr:ATP synthase F1 subunit epsilon [Stellaceae bacterium]
MADTVQFELVSPERMLRSEAVEMVVVPGSEGNFGVLPGHSPLISSVRPGTIEVYSGTTVTERIFVSGGFAEVTAERCTVLADDAVDVAALDRTAVEANLAMLQGALAGLRDAADKGAETERDAARQHLSQAERNLAIATAKLEALDSAAAR